MIDTKKFLNFIGWVLVCLIVAALRYNNSKLKTNNEQLRESYGTVATECRKLMAENAELRKLLEADGE